MQEFEQEEIIIQLKCNNSHIFHESCLNTFLYYIKKDGVSEPKCTICKSEI